ncbi:hypothetical protein PoB_002367000 [Plakobranchus ocellatus]|uniref:Uncharacterized protein n=1 Tax=Plakobranchus ocellatus TaxID=259542 RepID=A0AAV3ZRE3_9GAST|nr:hypothetical protein PoB_002367000 [Plakobranchus ocellatus]
MRKKCGKVKNCGRKFANGAQGIIGSTVIAAGRKRRPRQVVAYGLPLVQDKVASLFPPGFCLLFPLPFLRYRPVYFSFCCPLFLSLPMWSLGKNRPIVLCVS